MPLVSVTRLHLGSWWPLLAFQIQSLQAALQARKALGNIAVTIMADADGGYWTRTVWSDENAMRAFLLAGPHRRAMSRLATWCDEAALVHWTQDAPEPPSWEEAHRRLIADGRPSTVARPSEAQKRFVFPPPRIKRQLKLK
jgi:hypothetical protein